MNDRLSAKICTFAHVGYYYFGFATVKVNLQGELPKGVPLPFSFKIILPDNCGIKY